MLTKKSKSKFKHKAFSLIELLVVVILLGIIVAMVATSSGGNDGIALKNAVISLQNEIREAAELATRDQRPVKMVFKSDGTIEVIGTVKTNNTEKQGVINRATGVPFKFTLLQACNEPVIVEEVNLGSNDRTLYISSEGKPVKGSMSSIEPISRDNKIVFSLRGKKFTVKVNPVTMNLIEVKPSKKTP